MNWDIVIVIAEVIGALAVVVSLIYVARQIHMSNHFARAEAYRSSIDALNSLNAAFAVDPLFRSAWRRCLEGANREELDEDERIIVDGYLISVTNIYTQLLREKKEGILDPEDSDITGMPLFTLPYYRASWPHYREVIISCFVEEFENNNNLDPSIEVKV